MVYSVSNRDSPRLTHKEGSGDKHKNPENAIETTEMRQNLFWFIEVLGFTAFEGFLCLSPEPFYYILFNTTSIHSSLISFANARILPLCRSATAFATDKPIPYPPVLELRDLSVR